MQAKSIEEQLKNVDKEWTTFYEETFKTNKSAKEIQGILERRIASDKSTPELFVKELASTKKLAEDQKQAEVTACRVGTSYRRPFTSIQGVNGLYTKDG